MKGSKQKILTPAHIFIFDVIKKLQKVLMLKYKLRVNGRQSMNDQEFLVILER